MKNVLIDPLQDGGKLHLANTPGAGEAISQPFTPALDIGAWQTISYTGNIPTGSDLTVSVLSADKTVLLPAVAPGDSLAGINPLDHPSLRLKVEMSTASGESPELLEWCILAKPKVSGVYLPLVIK